MQTGIALQPNGRREGYSHTAAPSANVLVTRFNNLAPLSDQDRAVLRLIERRTAQAHAPDNCLLKEGAEIRSPRFIMTGWAARVRMLGGGRRQIISVLLPGDAIGLCARERPLSPTLVVALTPLRMVEAPEIAVAWRDHRRAPTLSDAIELAAAQEEFFLLSQVTRLGRQTAYERMAHWFLELEYRLSACGLLRDGAIPFPVTQTAVADVLGLSGVHVNRTIQQMRSEGHIELTRGRLVLTNREALREAAEFKPPVLWESVEP